MKGILSHCMIRHIAVVACLSVCAAAQAQTLRYESLERNNLWNDGSNVAAIRLDTLSYADVAIGASYETGSFRSYDQSSSQWGADVLARAVTQLEKFSLRGSFGFSDVEAYDMCGSMFMRPGFFPVDVMEFTPGRKSFQKYSLGGGISVPLSGRWLVGASMNFLSANAAKRKDLRYTGYCLDLEFAPSLLYVAGNFSTGLSLVYVRNTESIDAEQIGSTQTAPFAFFNEGLYYGNYQVWTGSGTRLSESGIGLPVSQNSLGVALQAGYGNRLYADVSFSYLKGKVGEKQTVWYRYEGPGAEARLDFRAGRHTLRSRFGWSRINNRESVLDKVAEGGVINTVEYASNRLFSSNRLNLALEYEYLAPAFEIRPSVEFSDRQSLVLPKYPETASQELRSVLVGVEARLRAWLFEISPRLGWYAGETVEFSEASGRMDDLYAYACEYETAPRVLAGAELRFNFPGGCFISADGGLVRAFKVNLLPGNMRWSAGLKFGYNF